MYIPIYERWCWDKSYFSRSIVESSVVYVIYTCIVFGVDPCHAWPLSYQKRVHKTHLESVLSSFRVHVLSFQLFILIFQAFFLKKHPKYLKLIHSPTKPGATSLKLNQVLLFGTHGQWPSVPFVVVMSPKAPWVWGDFVVIVLVGKRERNLGSKKKGVLVWFFCFRFLRL